MFEVFHNKKLKDSNGWVFFLITYGARDGWNDRFDLAVSSFSVCLLYQLAIAMYPLLCNTTALVA